MLPAFLRSGGLRGQRLRTLRVSLVQVRRAIQRAHARFPDDPHGIRWQAENIEILLIPKVYRRWQQLNPHAAIERVEGEFRYAPGTSGPGYVVTVARGISWNSIGTHGYGTAWDGIRRETISMFADGLRYAWMGYKPLPGTYAGDVLLHAGIEVVP